MLVHNQSAQQGSLDKPDAQIQNFSLILALQQTLNSNAKWRCFGRKTKVLVG